MAHSRASRLPAWVKRLSALLAVFVLLGQSLLGGNQLCALMASVATDDCCAGEAAQAVEAAPVGALLGAMDHPHDANGDCSCPFECATGCCSPTRAIVSEVAVLASAVAVSGKLALTEAEQAPASAEPRGILHVPKLAA